MIGKINAWPDYFFNCSKNKEWHWSNYWDPKSYLRTGKKR